MVEPRASFFLSSFHIKTRRQWSSKSVYNTHYSDPQSAINPRVQDEVISQQVGDWITCPVAQLELRAALPTSAFGGITDVFPPSLQAHQAPVCAPKNPAATPRDRNHTISHMTYQVCFLLSDLQRGSTRVAGVLPTHRSCF